MFSILLPDHVVYTFYPPSKLKEDIKLKLHTHCSFCEQRSVRSVHNKPFSISKFKLGSKACVNKIKQITLWSRVESFFFICFIPISLLYHGACPMCKDFLSDSLGLMHFLVRQVHSITCSMVKESFSGNIIWRSERS